MKDKLHVTLSFGSTYYKMIKSNPLIAVFNFGVTFSGRMAHPEFIFATGGELLHLPAGVLVGLELLTLDPFLVPGLPVLHDVAVDG